MPASSISCTREKQREGGGSGGAGDRERTFLVFAFRRVQGQEERAKDECSAAPVEFVREARPPRGVLSKWERIGEVCGGCDVSNRTKLGGREGREVVAVRNEAFLGGAVGVGEQAHFLAPG